MDLVAYAVARCFEKRNDIRGLQMTFEPENLRFFQAHFEPLPAPEQRTVSAFRFESNELPLNYQI
jgi:hypothetical protein